MALSNGRSYTKRRGTGGLHGQKYEIKMACLLFLRAIASGNAFQLAANMDGAGAFDDLVLQIHNSDGPSRTFFIQLKHKQKLDKTVSRSMLLSLTPKNDFSLLKYFLSFRDEVCANFESKLQDRSLVLYTNASVQYEPDVSDEEDELLRTSPNGLIFSFKRDIDQDVFTFVQHIESYRTFLTQLQDNLKGINNTSTIIEEEVIKFMENYKHEYRFHQRIGSFSIYEIANKLKMKPNLKQIVEHLKRISDFGDLSNYDSFLQNLKVCTKQGKETDIDGVIQEELSRTFGICPEYSFALIPNLLAKIQQWWAAEHGTYLTEESPLWIEIIQEALSVTNKRAIKDICSLKIKFNENEIQQLEPTLVAGRVVLCLVEEECTKVGVHRVVQTLQQMNVRFLLGSNDNALGFWESRWCDFLVVEFPKDNPQIFSRIKEIFLQHPDNRLIVVAQENELNTVREIINSIQHEVVEVKLNFNFTCLDDRSKNKVLTKTIFFQGHKVPLGKLIQGQQQIMEEVEAELLIKILKDESIHLGKRLEKLLPHYIPRNLQRTDLVRPDLLRNSMRKRSRIFTFSGVCEAELQNLVPFGEEVRRFDGRLTPGCRFYMVDDKDLASLGEQTEEFVCVDKEEDSLHAQSWSGDIDINQLVDHSKARSLNPNTVRDLPGRVAVIAAEPGMGKSTLTTCMALRTKDKEPAIWVVKVNLNRMTSYLDTVVTEELTKEHAINFLAEAAEVTDIFQKRLFQLSVETIGSVVVFFDGFDEICPDYKDEMLAILRYLLQTNIQRIWITSRLNWRQMLEQSMVSIAFTVEEFSSEDQRSFLENVWSERVGDVDKNHLQNFISHVLRLFTESFNDVDRSFLGIPLQTMIVAEIFEHHLREGLGPKHMDVVQLYEELFRKKCKVFFEQKRGDNITHPVVKNKINIEQSYIEEMHICSAIVLYMSSKDISTLHDKHLLSNGIKYLKENTSDWLTIGIIQSGAHGNPEFLHRTLMEFFVSKWLLHNYQHNITFLQNKIFTDDYFVVRRMFNIMLTDGFPIHRAALNCDVEHLKRHVNNENVNFTDKGGRTPLHVVLAGNFGHVNIRETVLILLNYGANVDVLDRVLQWSSIQYADYSGNWMALGMILQERKVITELDYIKPRMAQALHVASREGLVELVRYLVTEDVNVNIELASSGERALHVAVQYDQIQVLECLLKAGAEVDGQDKRDYTALHLAAETGRMSALVSLLGAGADINATSLFHMTALHHASKNGHIDVVKTLLSYGSQTDVEDVFGNTPLDLSSVNRHDDITNCLLEVDPEMNRSPLENAIRRGDLDTVKLLLANNCAPSLETGETPLHTAVGLGQLDIAFFLIQNGVPVDTLDESEMNPLHVAVIKGHFKIVRLLLDSGSKANSPISGMLPLHLAANLGHLDIVRLFLEEGSEVDVRDWENWTPLHYSAKGGHLDIVELLLENGSKVNALDDKNKTALHYSASEGHLDVTRLLINYVCMVNILDHNHQTPLHCAARGGYLEIVRLMTDKGCLVNAQDKDNKTPLYWALTQGHLDIAQFLIEKGVSINDKDDGDRSVLHHAAGVGHYETVRFLIDNGAIVEARDADHRTPLHCAAAHGHMDIVLLLIEKGATVQAKDVCDRISLHYAAEGCSLDTVRLLINKGSAVCARDKNNQTPLHFASTKGRPDVTQLLIEKGATVNTVDIEKKTALHCAANNGHLETVQILIMKGSAVYSRDIYNRTPLHCASSNGHLDVVRQLIGNDAAVNATDAENRTALHCAAGGGNLEVIRFLLKKGGTVHGRDMYHRTPLHCAAAEDHLEVARLLIQKGVAVNATDLEHRIPLHYAAMEGHSKAVRLLIDSGSCVDARSKDQSTPLHYAAWKGHVAVVKFLVECGSPVDALDRGYSTPLDLAISSNHTDVVEFLTHKTGKG